MLSILPKSVDDAWLLRCKWGLVIQRLTQRACSVALLALAARYWTPQKCSYLRRTSINPIC